MMNSIGIFIFAIVALLIFTISTIRTFRHKSRGKEEDEQTRT